MFNWLKKLLGLKVTKKIIFKNGSTIWVTTDSGKYKHVVGKSTKLLKLDEYYDDND